MIHRKVLEQTGCTAERIRQIATAEPGKPEHKIRQRWEKLIQSRITDGVASCVKHSRIPQAVDMAWDSTPIQKQTIPLLLYAQGKIDLSTLGGALKQAGCASEYLREVEVKDKEGKVTGKEMKLDLPRLYEVSINLIRSYVTRRLASQTARFSNLWPYFKYEPRGVDLVSKLRAEALSERVDVMANQYNYRHFFPQTFRHQFLYGRSVIFARSAWDKVEQWRPKNPDAPVGELEIESYVEREGIDPVAPHITRVFADRSAPLANINTNTGPSYIAYWDIIPFRDVDSSTYYNKDCITAGAELADLITNHSTYFGQYFDPKVIKLPELKPNPAAANERLANVATYNSAECDKGVLVTQYYWRINPKHEGVSDTLNTEVWMRLAVAGDNTIIGGEFLTTSIPACYGGLNENDDREINPSMASELMAIQDQLTNIWSQMLMNIRAGMLQIWAIDQDVLEPEMKKFIRDTLKSKDYYSEPQAFFFSGEKLRNLGVANPADNPRAFLTIIQANVQTSIETSMRAVGELLNMADRLLMVSPNEGGQPNPREVAAREITEISTTTDTIRTFVSDGIDEQRAAFKRMVYESLVCESTQTVRVPVMGRYTLATIREAGFDVPNTRASDAEIIPLKTPIMGKAMNLVFDYYFDSRDGGDRPLNSQGANIMGTLLGQFMQVEPIARAFGKRRLFEWTNEIVRMSGAPIDLKFELEDGEADDIVGDTQLAEVTARLQRIEEFLAGQGAAAAPAAPTATPSSAPAPASPAATDGAQLPAEAAALGV